MKNKKECLILYKQIILYAKEQENLRKQAIDYLDKQTNDKFNIYNSQEVQKNKVKVLTLGSNHLL